ncbi:Eukaryotic translation initiation factor 3 subunit A [Frankliniella fusca]|uniref:Eukaryotic translation initiation factor 3 subunit A n=1 Tax=Frankliniella fusca TaxID=407009 RepID=A0AAE1H4E6_9NEOP|nr:Eukaryotic translation initiation factor 3 subunit A [Frankliniella fusca]
MGGPEVPLPPRAGPRRTASHRTATWRVAETDRGQAPGAVRAGPGPAGVTVHITWTSAISQGEQAGGRGVNSSPAPTPPSRRRHATPRNASLVTKNSIIIICDGPTSP